MSAGSAPDDRVGRSAGTPRESRPDLISFDVFTFRAETGELWKHGIRLKLQQKPRLILEALVRRPGELITREQLRQILWPEGTFVDFESGLNTAVNRLRVALGDSAETPRFIETLPRLGYRFICPVDHPSTGVGTTIHSIVLTSEDKPLANESGLSLVTASNITPPRLDLKNLFRTYPGAFATFFAVTVFVVVALMLAWHHVSHLKGSSSGTFQQLTFRSGTVTSARFIGSSDHIAYTGSWEGGARESNTIDVRDLSSHPLRLSSGILASVSRTGNFGFIVKNPAHTSDVRLWELSGHDGTSRQLLESTVGADWFPDAQQMATVGRKGGQYAVEFPSGHVVYRSRGWITDVRVSPRGDQVAFLDHPVRDDDSGYVRVVDQKGEIKLWTTFWSSISGLSWFPSGREIWFSATAQGLDRSLYSSSGPGKLRLVFRGPPSVHLMDISANGRVLIALEVIRMALFAGLPGNDKIVDLSKFDYSHVDDMSADGRYILFTEGGNAGGKHYDSYLRDAKHNSITRVSEGRALALSRDGRRALTIDPEDRRSLVLHTFGASSNEETTAIIAGNGFEYQWARFRPGSDELIVGGSYPGGPLITAKQSLKGTSPMPLEAAPYLDDASISSDGKRLAGFADMQTTIYDLTDKSTRKLSSPANIMPVAWGQDGHSLYAAQWCPDTSTDLLILRLDLSTGNSKLWKQIPIRKNPGFTGLGGVVAAPEAGAFAYSIHQNLSRLFVVDGWS